MKILGYRINLAYLAIGGFAFMMIYFAWIRPTGDVVGIDKGTVFSFIMFIALISLEAMNEMMKAHSPQFVGDNLHCATDSWIETVGNWGVIAKDGVDAWGMHFKTILSTGTIVLPKHTVKRIGENIATNVYLFEVGIKELPAIVREWLRRNGKAYKDPFYFGFMTHEQLKKLIDIGRLIPDSEGLREMSVEDLLLTLLETNELVAIYKDLAHGKLDTVEDVASASSRIARKITRKSIWDIFKKKDEGQSGG